MKKLALPLLLSLTVGATISPFAAGCADSAGEKPEVSEAELATELGLTSVRSASAFEALSLEGGGFGQAGRTMKFFIDARNPAAKQPWFVNMNYKVDGKTPEYAKYHYFFAQKQLGITESGEEFNDVTYFTDNKRYYAGTVQTYQIGDGAPLFAIQLYPNDVIHEQGIVELLKVIKSALTIPGARFAFVAGGPQQTFATIGNELRELGFEALTIEQVLGGVKYMPLNPGEAWGYLRIFPTDLGNVRPTDIVVFDELPLDLSVVAGTITRVFQDTTSHVNLKSKERGTPNMVLRDASKTNATLAALADKPVHMVVGKGGYVLEPTTATIVEEKFRARTNKPWNALPIVAEPNLVWFDQMCPTLSVACTQNGNRFGGKAAMLGFLANRSVLGRKAQPGSQSAKAGYDLVPQGFAIPVQYYRDFLGLPANAGVKAKVDALVASEKSGTLSPNDRRSLATEVQQLFYTAQVPAAQLANITAQVERLKALDPAIEKLKVRSSANAEDIPNFDGAGLHDSFGVKLSSVDAADSACRIEATQDGPVTKLEIKPKTIQCAIKGVYASLWNPRAIEERSFARLDHATASMGLAVVPAYDTEAAVVANGVLITRAINTDLPAQTLSLQKDNNLVTNPNPGTISQMTYATFSDLERPTEFTIARFATPTAGAAHLTASVLTAPQMTQISDLAKAVEVAYCKAKPGYYDGDCATVWIDSAKPRSLDMEFKFLENGHFVLKQSREFHGQ